MRQCSTSAIWASKQCRKYLPSRQFRVHSVILVLSATNWLRSGPRTEEDTREAIMVRAFVYAAATLALTMHASAQVPEFRPVTDAILANPDPADWLMLNRTFDQQRFS